MNFDTRQRLVRRLDSVFFIGLLLTSGLAALLFWTQFYSDAGEDDDEMSALVPTPVQSPMLPATATASPTSTPTETPTATFTPSPLPTLTHTPTSTATLTPRPTPFVTVLSLVAEYAEAPLSVSGHSQPNALILLYDLGVVVASTTASADGEWLIEMPAGLPEGLHALSVEAALLDGPSVSTAPLSLQLKSRPTPTPTATNTVVPTPTTTDTPFPTQTHTPSSTPTPAPSLTPTHTQISTPVPTKTATVTATATPTTKPLDTPTIAASATRTPEQVAIIASDTPASTDTAVPTATSTLTPLPTDTASPSATFTLTATPSPIPPTSTPLPTATLTASHTPTATETPTATATPSPVPPTDTPTYTPSATIAPTQPPSDTPTTLPADDSLALLPHIDTPGSGDVFSPGPVTFSGTAAPGSTIEIQNQETGETLATVTVEETGTWQVSISLQGEGPMILAAADTGTTDLTVTSDPVMITLAPAVQPATGATLNRDRHTTGRAFTALVALLLSAGGFSTYFAGRLIYLVAKDRSRFH